MLTYKFDRKKFITNKCEHCGHDVVMVGDTCLHFTIGKNLEGNYLSMGTFCNAKHKDTAEIVETLETMGKEFVKNRCGDLWEYSMIPTLSSVECSCKNPEPLYDGDTVDFLAALKKNVKTFPKKEEVK
jgi:hypothetical protein